jgi:hypothetical protein
MQAVRRIFLQRGPPGSRRAIRALRGKQTAPSGLVPSTAFRRGPCPVVPGPRAGKSEPLPRPRRPTIFARRLHYDFTGNKTNKTTRVGSGWVFLRVRWYRGRLGEPIRISSWKNFAASGRSTTCLYPSLGSLSLLLRRAPWFTASLQARDCHGN